MTALRIAILQLAWLALGALFLVSGIDPHLPSNNGVAGAVAGLVVGFACLGLGILTGLVIHALPWTCRGRLLPWHKLAPPRDTPFGFAQQCVSCHRYRWLETDDEYMARRAAGAVADPEPAVVMHARAIDRMRKAGQSIDARDPHFTENYKRALMEEARKDR